MRPPPRGRLTPLECKDPRCIPINIQRVLVTSLESALTSHSQVIEKTATLTLVESALTRNSLVTPLECALTENTGVGGGVLKFFLFILFRTLFLFFALATSLTIFFSSNATLFLT